MCPDNINECVLAIETNKPLETHEQIFGNSWAICSMVSPRFSGVIAVLSGDEVNSIFHSTLMIRFEGLPRDLCYGLYLTTAIIN